MEKFEKFYDYVLHNFPSPYMTVWVDENRKQTPRSFARQSEQRLTRSFYEMQQSAAHWLPVELRVQ